MSYKVSILTPCYNSEKYIGRFIDSILKQKHNDIELVIINDGSTDQTENVILSYNEAILKRGYSLNYHQKDNGGIGSAINLALKKMTGDYFCWCDSDNFYDENYVSEKIKVFKNKSNCNIVRCDGYFVYEDDINTPYRKFSDGNNDLYKKDLFLNSINEKDFHFGCAMIKTSAFDNVVKNRDIYESRQGQNWQILLPVFYKYKSYYIDQALFYFVNRRDSISGQTEQGGLKAAIDQVIEHEKILLETLKRMKIHGIKYYEYIIKIKYINIRIFWYKLYNDLINSKREEQELIRTKKNFNWFKKVFYKILSYRIIK